MNSYILFLSNHPQYEYKNLVSSVSSARQQKLSKFHFDIDKRLSLYSELLIRMQLSIHFNVNPSSILFDTTAFGKPYIKNYPNTYISISHSNHAILIGISYIQNIGVDIEYIDCSKLNKEMLKEIIHPYELDRITSSFCNIFDLYQIWTRKEAYGKSNGYGLCQDLSKINTFINPIGYEYKSWITKKYMCSVYCKEHENININYLKEQDIIDFFIRK